MAQIGVPAPPVFWDAWSRSKSRGSDFFRSLASGALGYRQIDRENSNDAFKRQVHQDDLNLAERRLSLLEKEQQRKAKEDGDSLTSLGIDLDTGDILTRLPDGTVVGGGGAPEGPSPSKAYLDVPQPKEGEPYSPPLFVGGAGLFPTITKAQQQAAEARAQADAARELGQSAGTSPVAPKRTFFGKPIDVVRVQGSLAQKQASEAWAYFMQDPSANPGEGYVDSRGKRQPYPADVMERIDLGRRQGLSRSATTSNQSRAQKVAMANQLAVAAAKARSDALRLRANVWEGAPSSKVAAAAAEAAQGEAEARYNQFVDENPDLGLPRVQHETLDSFLGMPQRSPDEQRMRSSLLRPPP